MTVGLAKVPMWCLGMLGTFKPLTGGIMTYIDNDGNVHDDMKAYARDIKDKQTPNLFEETFQVWGVKSQLMKFSEELFELGVAMHHWYDDKVSPEDLAEEVADVEIVCAQLRNFVGDDMVTAIKIKKLERLRKRVNDAKKETGSH